MFKKALISAVIGLTLQCVAQSAEPAAGTAQHLFSIAVMEQDANGNQKVLANPTLCTLDGRPVFFNIGGEVPVKSTDGSVQFVHVGTSVRLTPKRNTAGKLNVAMQIENSRVEKEGDPLQMNIRRVNSLCEDVEANGIHLEMPGSPGTTLRIRVQTVKQQAKEEARFNAFMANVRVFEVATDGSEKPVAHPQFVFPEDAPAYFRAGAELGAKKGKPGIPVALELSMKIIRLHTGKCGVQVQATLERETDRDEAEFATSGRCAKVIRELRNGEPFAFKLDSPVDGGQSYRFEVTVDETKDRPVKDSPVPVPINVPRAKQ